MNLDPPSDGDTTVLPNDENERPNARGIRQNLSKEDKKLEAAVSLRRNMARLDDAREEMCASLVDLKSDNPKVQERSIKKIESVVLPMMETALKEDIPAALKHVEAIPGVQYLHNTNEAKENQAARQMTGRRNRRKSMALKRVENALRDQRKLPNKKRRTSVARLPMQASRIQPTTPLLPPRREEEVFQMPRLSLPRDGPTYSAEECVAHLKELPKTVRRKVILRWKEANMIPVHETAVYRRLRAAAKGKPVREFLKPGRPKLLDDADIDEMAAALNTKHGRELTHDEVKEAIKEKTEERIRSEGRVPLQRTTPSYGSVVHYKAKLGEHEKVSISTASIAKTSSRITAENSLISAMALVVAVAATHYRVATEPQPEMEKRLKEKATPGALKLYEMLKVFHGPDVPLQAVKPCYNLSTDDTVSFIFAGKEGERAKFRLVGVESNKGQHTRLHYHRDDSNSMTGLRAKLTYTFSGVGVQAAPFITVSGLTDEELPVETCESGILCLAIEGLTVAGGGVTVGNKGTGYLLFIRNDGDRDKDKKRVRFYRDYVLIPFIKQLRKEYDGWQEGTPIEDTMEVVSWCDGDNAQIQAILDSIAEYNENRVVAMKQNAARTGTEQAADLARVFPNMEVLHRKVTLVEVPADLNPLKMGVSCEFDELTRKKVLNLPPGKRNALIDLVACVPQTMARACTTTGILHGFKENGMLDKSTARYPDYYKMLSTCRTNPTKEQMEACEKAFPVLLQEFIDHGHVPDRMFEEHLDPDINPVTGDVVRREAEGPDSESRQRCKCLNHAHQVQLRTEKLARLVAEKARVEADRRKGIIDTLALNAQCQDKLGTDIQAATMADFAKCTRPLLKAFIQVRVPTAKIGSMKKGTVAEAEDGTDNLIQAAWWAREKDIALEASDEEPTDSNEDEDKDLPPSPTLEAATIRNVNMGRAQLVCNETAADILDDEEWVAAVAESFLVEGKELNIVDEEMKKQANTLQTMLLNRIQAHAIRRVGNNKSWVFQFCADNTARLAAFMVLQGHVKPDLTCLGGEKTLLANSTINFSSARSQQNKTREGTYLYYDTNDGVFIRSGKVAGRSFKERDDEHCAAASKGSRAGEDSLFYRRYPSRTLVDTNNLSRKGIFENLLQLVAMSYDPDDPNLDSNINIVVSFSDYACERIRNVKFGVSNNTMATNMKLRHVTAYLFELGYDVAIAIADNVSSSPGFESCGLFPKRK